MHPFSYTTVKVIHDEKVQQALKQRRNSQKHQPRTASPRTTRGFAALFARFHRPAPSTPLPCAELNASHDEADDLDSSWCLPGLVRNDERCPDPQEAMCGASR
jgi:hypothetical protein